MNTQNRFTTPEGTNLIAVPQIDDLRPCAGCHWAEDAGTRPGLRCTRPLDLRDDAPCVAGAREDGRDVVWQEATDDPLLALFLADELQHLSNFGDLGDVPERAASELRRLHAVELERDQLRARVAELEAGVIPPGFKMVPLVPTSKMIANGRWSGCGDVSMNEDWARREMWDRMLVAAPNPPAAARVPLTLTDERITQVYERVMGQELRQQDRPAVLRVCHAVIEAAGQEGG